VSLLGPLAHGLAVRADLPIPAWLFGVAAGVVLVVSFVTLALLWKRPLLEDYDWRPLHPRASRILTSRALELLCGAIGVFLFVLCVVAGFAGIQSPADNFTPTFVYVVFWVGLVPASVLFGDVFRAFNPWLAIGRAASWAASKLGGEGLGSPNPYPAWLGRWPAAAGLVAWGWFELASSGGPNPRNLAEGALIYSAITFVGMGLFGVEEWSRKGEAFGVYFGLFARMSVFERRGDEIGTRPPLAGLTRLEQLPGTVAVLAVMIGTVTFDGAQETSIWGPRGLSIASFFASAGASPALADELAAGVGLFTAIVLVGAFYVLGVAGARTAGGGYSVRELANAFVHSLVPISLAYVLAHYLTFLLFQGQAMAYLISDPLGKGWDLFGTYNTSIDYSLINATQTWYFQVAVVVAGHVSGLTLAHDRALVLYEDRRAAVRSQWWLLAVMIGFTSLALYLLSKGNA
jgi:hypothetical protein